jgi:hypothetical protein
LQQQENCNKKLLRYLDGDPIQHVPNAIDLESPVGRMSGGKYASGKDLPVPLRASSLSADDSKKFTGSSDPYFDRSSGRNPMFVLDSM